jgi:hypothetical protein
VLDAVQRRERPLLSMRSMKSFQCKCGAGIFFRNSRCLACKRELGFLPDRLVLSALEPEEGRDELRALAASGARYRKCASYAEHDACNWMIPELDGPDEPRCISCRLDRTIPSLDSPENVALWSRIEVAKRHLIYTLLSLRLPLDSKAVDPEEGLAFDLLIPTPEQPVTTGHAHGVITLSVAEADPVACEKMRVELGERYRTLLGHFRHESGHYYFDRLLRDGPDIERFRELFGDEREDYAKALERHYAEPPGGDWHERFISAYAHAHPWEDWAETWAHYLHMLDTLETARAFGLAAAAQPGPSFDACLSEWLELSVALNALNRSMGLPDPYPFHIAPLPARKLAFVHEIVSGSALAPGAR